MYSTVLTYIPELLHSAVLKDTTVLKGMVAFYPPHLYPTCMQFLDNPPTIVYSRVYVGDSATIPIQIMWLIWLAWLVNVTFECYCVTPECYLPTHW